MYLPARRRRKAHKDARREPGVEGVDTLNRLDVLRSERDLERFDIGEELLDLADANDRKDECRFMHEVRDSD